MDRFENFWSLTPDPALPSRIDHELARRSLAKFVAATAMFTPESWQEMMCARLERLEHEVGQRVLIHGPPQHGKSVILSQRFPAWLMGRKPDVRIRLACYNQTHATSFGRVNLQLMQSPEFVSIFPDNAARVPKMASGISFSTRQRAKFRDGQASFDALGLGSGFVGKGADLLLVDDPYKNREEAYSETINEGIWLWWTDVVIPRLNPLTNVVVLFHRWKEDDLAGRLIEQGGWEQMRFPAIADGELDDPTIVAGIRQTGDPLSPRYPADYLQSVEEQIGASSYLALYQGRPIPIGGKLFKEYWFAERYKSLPKLTMVATFWDTALKADEENDETACLTLGVGEDGKLHILRVVHGNWETPVVADFMARQAQWLKNLYGDAYRGDYVEDKVSGTTLMQYMRRTYPKIVLIPVKAESDKVARARGVTPLVETGRILLPDLAYYPPAREFTTRFLAQVCSFPGGKRDDMVDTFVYALMWFLGTLRTTRPTRKKGQKLV